MSNYRGVMDLVFLHGRAASGKLTTARALEQLLGYPVFHNHLVVDLLTPFFPFGSDAFIALREEFWIAVFGQAARVGRSITFTFTPEQTVPEGFPRRVKDVVGAPGGRVADLATLRRHRGQPPGEQPPAGLEIDTTTSTPVESAERIAQHFGLKPGPQTERYPSSEPRR